MARRSLAFSANGDNDGGYIMTSFAVHALKLGKMYERPVAGKRKQTEEFWALRDAEFAIPEGQICGIVGRNGAGKSTLLKLLSRITAPTAGEIRIKGRVGSLLEVGTGFHPELSGRENVFLNGAILGMRRREISRKFDQIVDFSGVGDFIDMPVKRYSSGMYMRLAFAVAAHLEPDVLIVDEVLAVGDADFQKKCLGKMNDVASSGRTVLFVSHNLGAIRQLCRRVLWLERGKLIEDSQNIEETIRRYMFGEAETSNTTWLVPPDAPLDTEYFSLHCFSISHASGMRVSASARNDEPLVVTIDVTIHREHPALNFGYVVFDAEGNQVYWTATTDTSADTWPNLSCGRRTVLSDFPVRLLNAGTYRIDFFASLHAKGYLSEPGKTLQHLTLTISGGLSDSPYWRDPRPGIIAPEIKWRNA